MTKYIVTEVYRDDGSTTAFFETYWEDADANFLRHEECKHHDLFRYTVDSLEDAKIAVTR